MAWIYVNMESKKAVSANDLSIICEIAEVSFSIVKKWVEEKGYWSRGMEYIYRGSYFKSRRGKK